MLNAWINLGMGSLAVAAIAVTVTRAKIFRPFREWILKLNEFWGDLFSCTYCFTHWMSIAYVALCQSRVIVTDTGYWWLDYIVSTFALITISSAAAGYLIVKAQDD